MANRFNGLSGMADVLKNFKTPSMGPSVPIIRDQRSRIEVREDFEKELAELDKDALIELKDTLQKIGGYGEPDEAKFWSYKNEIENVLIKLIRYMNTFDELNSQESRGVALKEKELALEARHDWAEKFRLFFFRVLASMLFIVTLFAIGYIEHNYDWARLPMSKYINTMPAILPK